MTILRNVGQAALMILMLPVYIVTAPLWILALVMYVRWLNASEESGREWDRQFNRYQSDAA